MMPAEPARLGFDRNDRAFLYGVSAVIGLLVGVAAPFVARWAADLPWIPFRGPLQLVGSFDSSWAIWGRPVLGVLAGLAFAAHVVHQAFVVVVAAEWIEIGQRGSTRRIQKSDVAAIYRDGGKIVIDSHRGRRLFHGEIEGGKDEIRDAFITHGYPWETT